MQRHPRTKVLKESESLKNWREIDAILQNNSSQKQEWQDFNPNPENTNQHVLTLRSLRRLLK